MFDAVFFTKPLASAVVLPHTINFLLSCVFGPNANCFFFPSHLILPPQWFCFLCVLDIGTVTMTQQSSGQEQSRMKAGNYKMVFLSSVSVQLLLSWTFASTIGQWCFKILGAKQISECVYSRFVVIILADFSSPISVQLSACPFSVIVIEAMKTGRPSQNLYIYIKKKKLKFYHSS